MHDTETQIEALQDNLEMLRKLFGWTAEQFGNRLGVTKQTILNLEHGNPKMSKIQFIAIRSIMEQELELREPQERESLLIVMKVVFNESDKELNEEQRSKVIETANVVAAARANGAKEPMSVLSSTLDAVGFAAIATGTALTGPVGIPLAAFGIGAWLHKMLKKTKEEEKKKKDTGHEPQKQ